MGLISTLDGEGSRLLIVESIGSADSEFVSSSLISGGVGSDEGTVDAVNGHRSVDHGIQSVELDIAAVQDIEFSTFSDGIDSTVIEGDVFPTGISASSIDVDDAALESCAAEDRAAIDSEGLAVSHIDG